VADLQRFALPAGALIAAAVIWYVWTNEGQAHNVSIDFNSETQYDPYAWWAGHSKGNAYVHHYPESVGQNCLPAPIDNLEGSYSLTFSEAGNG
jgi:hypothetical protein